MPEREREREGKPDQRADAHAPASQAQVCAVARHFAAGREVRSARRIGSGHIHETHRVELAVGAGQGGALVVQRMNEHVFADLDALQANLERVTRCLARERRRRSDPERPDCVLEVLPSADGASFVRDEDGAAWRAFPFLDETRAFDVAETPALVFAAARAFGDFARTLAELPPDELVEVIPGFHDTAGRFSSLVAAVERDAVGRAEAVAGDVDRVRRLWDRVRASFTSRGGLELPRRVVHNDCKLNNALFDPAGRSVRCIVDLDTTWAGTLACDLGELLRTTSSHSPEDEPRPERIRLEPARLEAAAQGYLRGLREPAGELETGVLPLAGALMALENAARFLADHLDGDRYFPAQHEGHNLQRARAQSALAEQLAQAEGDIRRALRG